LNRLAKEYEILPEGANLSVEIVQEFPYCGAFLGELGAKLLADVILIRQKVKSPKKYSKSQFTERKQNTSLHSLSSLHGLQSAQSAVGSLHFNVTAMTVLSSNCYLMYLFLSHLVVTSIYILQ